MQNTNEIAKQLLEFWSTITVFKTRKYYKAKVNINNTDYYFNVYKKSIGNRSILYADFLLKELKDNDKYLYSIVQYKIKNNDLVFDKQKYFTGSKEEKVKLINNFIDGIS